MKWLFYILILFTFLPVAAQEANSTKPVVVRKFDSKALQEHKNDEDMQYDRMKEPKLSWWDRFWLWFWWQIDQMLRTKQGRATFWSVLVLVAVVAIGFAVYKIRKMHEGGLFVSGSGKGLDFTVGHEDIHQINFDDAIAAAIQQKDYRLAVRLLYLQTLKLMTDRNVIEWKINKTNNDYVREVKGKDWQPLFSKLTYQFEYAWYGEAQVPEERFDNLRNDFKHLHNQV